MRLPLTSACVKQTAGQQAPVLIMTAACASVVMLVPQYRGCLLHGMIRTTHECTAQLKPAAESCNTVHLLQDVHMVKGAAPDHAAGGAGPLVLQLPSAHDDRLHPAAEISKAVECGSSPYVLAT